MNCRAQLGAAVCGVVDARTLAVPDAEQPGVIGIDRVHVAELERVGAGHRAGLPCRAAIDGTEPRARAPLTQAIESVTALTAISKALVWLTWAVCETLTGAGAGVRAPEQAARIAEARMAGRTIVSGMRMKAR